MCLRLAEHCGRALADLAETDPRLWVLDGDLADSDGAEHFATRHPSRFLAAGIAEQNMVSVAAGMAEAEALPWVFSFASFLSYRAYDQVRVCLSQARQPVTLVGSHAGGLTGRNGKTHAATNDLAVMLSLPNVSVWAPGDAADVAFAVRQIHAGPQPTYMRLPRTPMSERDALPCAPAPVRWLREPRGTTALVSSGLASHWALDCARRLEGAGIDVGVLHVLRYQMSQEAREYLEAMRRVFVVEDHCRFGGLASWIQHHFPRLDLTGFGWPGDFSGTSGPDHLLLEKYGLSGAHLARDVAAMLDTTSNR